MDPALATALAPLIAALSTAILMYAAYHWPTGRNERDDEPSGRHARRSSRRRRKRDED